MCKNAAYAQSYVDGRSGTELCASVRCSLSIPMVDICGYVILPGEVWFLFLSISDRRPKPLHQVEKFFLAGLSPGRGNTVHLAVGTVRRFSLFTGQKRHSFSVL